MRGPAGLRSLTLVDLVLVALTIVLAGVLWQFRTGPAAPPGLVLRPAAFQDLPGWRKDDLMAALPALRRSCAALGAKPVTAALGGAAGLAGDWRAPCAALLGATDRAALAAALEVHFQPLAVLAGAADQGLFTGYYEPVLAGRRQRDATFNVPLHRRPADLVEVDLGRFRDDLKGRRIAGRVRDGRLVPYAARGAIERGALAGRGLALLWLNSPIDRFFLQIQGSGRIELGDGETVRVGYDGQNGQPYTAIGRSLIRRGEIPRERMSMQAIRTWLEAHPGEAAALMRENRSYVFFREIAGDGPIGAAGYPLTPGRSLAVDRRWHALGVPVWLATTQPSGADGARRPFRRLMVAQDTGGAIKGPVRGDVFFGSGPLAERVAGAMREAGRMWLLLPKALAKRAVADSK